MCTLKTLAILGPLGSGKTTLVNKILAGFSHLRVLVVVNDVGTENIDVRRIQNAGDIKALTAGCIGCSDLPTFKAIIEEAKAVESLDLLLIEPTGIADGREIRDAVMGSGCEFRAITLVDIRHFERNRALGCMESQLEAATTVFLTWTNNHPTPDKVLEYIGYHAQGRPILELDDVKTVVLATLDPEVVIHSHHNHGESCGCGHHHEHHRHHDHGDHGVYSFSIKLRGNTSYAELVIALAPHLSSLVRAKGVVSGRQFDYVHGDIQLGEANDAASHGNFIFNRKVEVEIFVGISKGQTEDIRSKKDRMRDADVPLLATLAAIEWQLGQYPPVITPSGIIRVDCEADVVYQLAKRPGVPDDVRQAVMRKYVSWRLEAAQRLIAGDWKGYTDLPYWQRRLGVNLGYMYVMHPDLIGEELMRRVAEIRPAEILAKGLLSLGELSFDEEKAEEKPETVFTAFGFGEADRKLLWRAIAHCQKLAEKNPVWHTRWKKVVLS